MPWKLIPPREGKTACWYIRGTYLGFRLDHSTGTGSEVAARRILKTWRKRAERGEFSLARSDDKQQPKPATFVSAATAYMQAGFSGQYLEPILKAWPHRVLTDIDQAAIDALAVELYPKASPATRNRQVYTPVSAVLKRAGIKMEVLRPKGWRGSKATSWLEPDQAFALFAAADKLDQEFGLLCRFLTYTGLRIDEALSRQLRDLRIERAYLYLPDSKTGEPRGCHLPPRLVQWMRVQPPRQAEPLVRDERGRIVSGQPVQDAGTPFLERHRDRKLFRFHDGGRLRAMLKAAMRAAGLSFPRRQGGFHIFCHTYGSWMHRYGKLDTHGLTRTGRWADADSANRYVHTQASEEARRADLLPVPAERGALVEVQSDVS